MAIPPDDSRRRASGDNLRYHQMTAVNMTNQITAVEKAYAAAGLELPNLAEAEADTTGA